MLDPGIAGMARSKKLNGQPILIINESFDPTGCASGLAEKIVDWLIIHKVIIKSKHNSLFFVWGITSILYQFSWLSEILLLVGACPFITNSSLFLFHSFVSLDLEKPNCIRNCRFQPYCHQDDLDVLIVTVVFVLAM